MEELAEEGSLGLLLQVAETSYGAPCSFLQCKPHLTLGGYRVLAYLASIDEEFRKACLLLFLVALGRGEPVWRNSLWK